MIQLVNFDTIFFHLQFLVVVFFSIKRMIFGNQLSRFVLKQSVKIVCPTIRSLSYPSSSANRKEPRRFYKNVIVCESSEAPNHYEILLDKKKLKTPKGGVFRVDSMNLASFIAHEWQAQGQTIKLQSMHLTSLLNTCLDNPNQLDKPALITNICNEYLPNDTVLYFNELDKKLQEEKWKPLVNWFNYVFPGINLKPTCNIDTFDTAPLNTTSFQEYLDKNFNFNCLIGFNYIAECLKSVILTTALLELHIETVDSAFSLSNLEQETQYDKWGRVEWYHDINENEVKARVSAGILFVYLSNKSKFMIEHRTKQINNNLV